MKNAAVVLGLAVGLGVVGVGLELAHPVFFVSENLVVWTSSVEGAPRLTLGGGAFPALWTSVAVGERVRWTGVLPPGAPTGVWTVCTEGGCHAFLRVPDVLGVVKVRATPGAELHLAGRSAVVDLSGKAFLVVPPGRHDLMAELGADTARGLVAVEPGARVDFDLVFAQLGASTPVALPGSAVMLAVRVITPGDHPALRAEPRLPDGWDVVSVPDVHEPVRAGTPATLLWRVTIPASAEVGEYTLTVGLADLGVQVHSPLVVSHRLPSRIVVCHWDVGADELDLSVPCAVTYDRLRWAATFVGRELPFTGRVFTQADFESLAKEWGTP